MNHVCFSISQPFSTSVVSNSADKCLVGVVVLLGHICLLASNGWRLLPLQPWSTVFHIVGPLCTHSWNSRLHWLLISQANGGQGVLGANCAGNLFCLLWAILFDVLLLEHGGNCIWGEAHELFTTVSLLAAYALPCCFNVIS